MLVVMVAVALVFMNLNMAFYLLFIEPLFLLIMLKVVGVNRVSVSVVVASLLAGVFYIISAPHRINRIVEFFS
ncbi:hypothetical protein [Sulfurimonas sp.]